MATEKFQNKYRIASARMKNYDYASNGAYFITIVTKNREHFFGDVKTPKLDVSTTKLDVSIMELSKIGEIAQKYWDEIPQHFSFIRLDEMVVMPNHIHGILIIDKTMDVVETTDVTVGNVETPKLGVSTTTASPIPPTTASSVPPSTKNSRNKNHKPEWKPGTIGVILNQFKRICTIKSRDILPDFAWQSRFHDRIIRDENELNRIREYIVKNPEI
jgi:REP element-mobilizing transposase RayT